MEASSPATVLEVVVRAIWDTLKVASREEKTTLSWKSTLAVRIELATLAALPRASIAEDVRWANLLMAASNICPSGIESDLDVGLAIGARVLFCRAFEDESDAPQDILIRMDILLAYIRESWLTDNIDLIRCVSKLRRQIAALVMTTSAWPPKGPSHPKPSPRHRNVVELVTGRIVPAGEAMT